MQLLRQTWTERRPLLWKSNVSAQRLRLRLEWWFLLLLLRLFNSQKDIHTQAERAAVRHYSALGLGAQDEFPGLVNKSKRNILWKMLSTERLEEQVIMCFLKLLLERLLLSPFILELQNDIDLCVFGPFSTWRFKTKNNNKNALTISSSSSHCEGFVPKVQQR